MAYVLDRDEQEEEVGQGSPKDKQQLVPDTGVVTGSSSGGPGATNSAPQAASDVSTVRKAQELNRDQAAHLANNLSNFELNKQLGSYQQKASGIGEEASQNIEDNTYNLDDDLRGFINDAFNKPSDVQDADLDRFGNIRDNVYGGQSDITQTQDAQLKAQKDLGSQGLAALDTEAGRKNALSGFYSSQMHGQRPTAGMVNFDEMLFQNNPEALQAFSGAKTNYNTQTDAQRAALAQSIAQQAEAAKAANKESSDFLQKRYGETDQAFRDRINQSVTQRQGDYDSDRALVEDFLNNYETGFDQPAGQAGAKDYSQALADLGITEDQIRNLIAAERGNKDVDLHDYFTSTAPTFTRGGVATDADREFYAGLNSLMNKSQDDFLSGSNTGGNYGFDYSQALADANYKEPVPPPPDQPEPVPTQSGGSGSGGLGEIIGGLGTANTIYERAKDLYEMYQDATTPDVQTFEEWVAANDPSYLSNLANLGVTATEVLQGALGGSTPAGSVTITEGAENAPANQAGNTPSAPSSGAGPGIGSAAGIGGAAAIGGALAGSAAPAGTAIITDMAGNVIGGGATVGGGAAGGAGAALGGGASADAAATGGSGIGGVAGTAIPVLAAVYGLYNTYEAAAAGNTGSAMMSGAATGAAIGSVVPVIGTAVGAVIGAFAGMIGSAFGDRERPSEAFYGSYKKVGDEANLRSWTESQVNGAEFEAIKSHSKSGNANRFEDVGDLYRAFGLKTDDYSGLQRAMDSFITGVIRVAQETGALPKDPKELGQLDGQQVFYKLVTPALAAKIEEVTGKPRATNSWSRDFSGGDSLFHNILADKTDWLMAKMGGLVGQPTISYRVTPENKMQKAESQRTGRQRGEAYK